MAGLPELTHVAGQPVDQEDEVISGIPSRSSLARANAPAPLCARERAENQPATRNRGPSAKTATTSAGKLTVAQTLDVARCMKYQLVPPRYAVAVWKTITAAMTSTRRLSAQYCRSTGAAAGRDRGCVTAFFGAEARTSPQVLDSGDSAIPSAEVSIGVMDRTVSRCAPCGVVPSFTGSR